eukprot:350075-Chlamydomonas_euryale.AAC.5
MTTSISIGIVRLCAATGSDRQREAVGQVRRAAVTAERIHGMLALDCGRERWKLLILVSRRP